MKELLLPAYPALFAPVWGLYTASGLPDSVSGPAIDWLSERGYIENLISSRFSKGRIEQTTEWRVTKAGNDFVKKELTSSKILRVYYNEDYYTIRERDVDDDWDQGVSSNGSSFSHAEVVDRTSRATDFRHEDLLLPSGLTGPVSLTWCTYATGSTFGRTEGQFGIGGIATDNAGVEWLQQVMDTRYDDYFGGLEQHFVETITLP